MTKTEIERLSELAKNVRDRVLSLDRITDQISRMEKIALTARGHGGPLYITFETPTHDGDMYARMITAECRDCSKETSLMLITLAIESAKIRAAQCAAELAAIRPTLDDEEADHA